MDESAARPLSKLAEEGVSRGAIARAGGFDLDQLMVVQRPNGLFRHSIRQARPPEPDDRLQLMSKTSQMPALPFG
jgi:hypothetical protein